MNSDPHNSPRFRQGLELLRKVGVHDAPEGRDLINAHLQESVANDRNIVKQWQNQYGSYQERESLFAGPGGCLVFRSSWEVMGDGTLRLTTIIPKG